MKKNWEKHFDIWWKAKKCLDSIGLDVDSEKVKTFICKTLASHLKEINNCIDDMPRHYVKGDYYVSYESLKKLLKNKLKGI